jgi:hypothetical protein
VTRSKRCSKHKLATVPIALLLAGSGILMIKGQRDPEQKEVEKKMALPASNRDPEEKRQKKLALEIIGFDYDPIYPACEKWQDT